MLRQFHYIDQNGKDQGINVRNRAQELAKLLSDVDLIRTERKKARANRNKFGGIEGGLGVRGGLSGSTSRYGGFGSESLGYGGYSGGVYGDGGGYGGNTSEFEDTGRRGNRFEEYDEYDEADAAPSQRRVASQPRATKQPEKPKEEVPDLFDFGDEPVTTSSSTAAGKQPASNAGNGLLDDTADDDEFDDFQSATPAPAAPAAPQPTSSNQFSIAPPSSTASTTQFAAPKPVSGTQNANLTNLVGISSITPTPTGGSLTSPMSPQGSLASLQSRQQPRPTGFQAPAPNYFTSVSAATTGQPTSARASVSSITSPASSHKPSASTSKAGGDAFGSLWSAASASAGIQKNSPSQNKGPNLASLSKEKASAGIWGTPAPSASTPTSTSSTPAFGQSKPPQQGHKPSGSALDDLLG